MTEETKRRTVYGLRHRESGLMVRVQEVPSASDDEVSYDNVTYRMTLDQGHPLFDARSVAGLSMAFAPTYGGNRSRPIPDGIAPGDVTPVVVEEVVTVTSRPVEVEFEVAERFASSNGFGVNRALAAKIDGLGEILDAVREHRDALEAVTHPGSEHPRGRCAIIGLAVPADVDEMPELRGKLVVTNGSDAPLRRALGTVSLPKGFQHLAEGGLRTGGGKACAIICLADDRPLPEDLYAALAPAEGPAPR